MDPIYPNSGFSRGRDAGAENPGRPPRLRKRRRGVALLPALFTLGNCLSGFASLNYAANGVNIPNSYLPSNYAIAGYFIFLAMIFDMFDGFVARITRSASDFGAELDSLADMVSFGIAPAFLTMHLIGDLWNNPALSVNGKVPYAALPGPFSDDLWLRLFWVIGATYVCCTALRLARFNVMNKHDALSHMSFRGMPSPGAAAVVASTVIFFESLRRSAQPDPGIHLWFNIPSPVQEVLRAILPYLLPAVLLAAAAADGVAVFLHAFNQSLFAGTEALREAGGAFVCGDGDCVGAAGVGGGGDLHLCVVGAGVVVLPESHGPAGY